MGGGQAGMNEYRWQLGWRKYLRVFNLGWQQEMEYRVNNLFESVIGLISFLVLFFLWQSIYQSNQGRPIAGMTFQEMLAYVLLAKFWGWIIDPGWEIDTMLPDDIRNGGLNRFLIRPISDRLYRFCHFTSHRILYGVMRLIPVAALIIFLPKVFSLPPRLSWWFLPAVGFLAFVLQFVFSYTVALIAFWWLEIWGVLFLKRLVVSFLAGAWLPLTLLPEKIAAVFLALPFQYMLFFPLQIALGKISLSEIWRGMLVQLVWIIIFIAASGFLWKNGLKRYTASGI
jgi:ABC-2 type transport system permease protein